VELAAAADACVVRCLQSELLGFSEKVTLA
jgi:hypothetical protein